MADFTNIVECSLQDDNSIYPRTCNVQSEEYDRETPGSEDMEMERPEVQSSQVVGKGWEITRMKYRGKGNTPSEDWVKGTLGYWIWMKLRKDDIKSTELESENTASEGWGRENNYNFRGLLGFKRGRNGKRTHRFWAPLIQELPWLAGSLFEGSSRLVIIWQVVKGTTISLQRWPDLASFLSVKGGIVTNQKCYKQTSEANILTQTDAMKTLWLI